MLLGAVTTVTGYSGHEAIGRDQFALACYSSGLNAASK